VKRMIAASTNLGELLESRISRLRRAPIHGCMVGNCHFGESEKYINVIKTLVKANARIDAKDVCGVTALHLGTQDDYGRGLPLVKALLKLKADVNLGTRNNTTALHFAASMSNYEKTMVESLLKAGADLDAESEGITCRYSLLLCGNLGAKELSKYGHSKKRPLSRTNVREL